MREAITNRIAEDGAIAVLRLSNPDKILHVVEALREGGVSIVEVTMTVPNALEHLERLAREADDSLLLGVGSVLDADTGRRAIEMGAQFVVSPVFRRELVDVAHAHDVPAVPGAFTPTEIQRAHEAGADMVKVFPATQVGPSYFQAVQAPLPHLRLMPTGGVTPDTAGDWIRAGAVAVGLGSALLDRAAIEEGRFEVLTQNAKRLRESVSDAQSDL